MASSSREGAMSATSSAVCCMCGDQGLADELFRCRCCRARLQHRYCSDLYPRAAAYRRCNWCLREPPGVGQGGRPAAAVPADNSKPEEKRKTTTGSASASDEERRQRREGCSPRSRSPPAELGHLPVKKKHRADAEEKTTPLQPPPAVPGKKETNKEVMRAGKARVNRVRVRRYKLLTEVISC